jgi:hypothetical protein
MTITYYQAPANSNDAAGRRAILDQLRAADNDNTPPPRLNADDDRAALLKPEFAARLLWLRLREVSESTGEATTWMAASLIHDDSMPATAEASGENLWSVDKLMQAAQEGVDFHEQHGRIVPYSSRAGALEYSGHTGRLIRCGALDIADDTRWAAANDDEAKQAPEVKSSEVEIVGGIRRPSSDSEPEPDELQAVDVFIEGASQAVRWHRGNVRTFDRRAPRAGSITGIRHRMAEGRGVTLTRPRNKDGAFRDRKTTPPEPIMSSTGEDVLDARQRLAGLISILSEQTVNVLDYSIDAPTFQSIGEMLGKSGDYAKRFGRRAIVKACAELDTVLQVLQYKYAA